MRRADALLAQLRHRPEDARPRLRLGHDEQELRPVAVAAALLGRLAARLGQRLLDPLEPGRPAGARRRRRRRAARSAGRSGRRRRSRSARRARRSGTRTPCACSSRARAPAAGRARSRCPRRRAAAAPRSKCSASASESRSIILGADSVTARDLRRVPVERAHRVDLDPRALIGVEHVVAEQELAQLARVLGARVRVADARQVQPHAGQAEPRVQVREQVDQLGVDGGVVGADRLGADLAVLAVAARTAAPRSGTSGPCTRASPAAGACACRARGRRGTRAPCPPGRSVSERPPRSSNVYISLRTMSVASPTVRTNRSESSKIGVSIWPKPAPCEQRPRLRHDLAPQRRPARAAGRRCRAGPGTSRPSRASSPPLRRNLRGGACCGKGLPQDPPAASSARNGFVRRSAPSVVMPMWPG